MPAVLRESEVVFMYRSTGEAYQAYGATFVAWGSARKPETVQMHHDMGIRCSGTMWCLTAGAQRLYEDPSLLEAVARDIEGRPVEVPWLFDVTCRGVKSFFGCTNNPVFREHNRHMVRRAMAAGADSLQIDDHMGVAHAAVWLGGGLCDHCIAAFRQWLGEHVSSADLRQEGVGDLAGFDYRDIIRKFAATRKEYMAVQHTIPLMDKFIEFHCAAAAENVRQLGEVGAQAAGHPILVSANAHLIHPQHRHVLPYVTHVVCEVEQHAEDGAANIADAVTVYELADKAGKPLAGTASGMNWAMVMATGHTEIARFWIALAYAHGQRFMTPHPQKQWCYTHQLGTHWYPAPMERFTPLYQFIRRNAAIFDDFKTAEASGIAAGPLVHCTLRRKGESSVLHLVNQDYHAVDDKFTPKTALAVSIPKAAIGAARKAKVFSFDAPPAEIAIRANGDKVELAIPELRLWSLVAIG